MRKENFVTHRIQFIKCLCRVAVYRADRKRPKPEERAFYLVQRHKPRTRADMLEELQNLYNTETEKVIKVLETSEGEGLFGMTKTDFLADARPMITRTRFK